MFPLKYKLHKILRVQYIKSCHCGILVGFVRNNPHNKALDLAYIIKCQVTFLSLEVLLLCSSDILSGLSIT
jgi:hypothetical protein